jgi:uncharacterized oligopeptide transporter (OPT) family protein
LRKWVYFGAAIILGLALYASGAIEGLALALLGVGSAGASKLIATRKETDKILDGMKRTTEKYDESKEAYREEVERIEKDVDNSPVADLLAAANERERKRNRSKS